MEFLNKGKILLMLYKKSRQSKLKEIDIIKNKKERKKMGIKRNQKSYDREYKAQTVKLSQEIGGNKAAKELGIPNGTVYTWIKAFK